MYNQVNTVWSKSNLSTVNSIDFANHKELCFDLAYYIPLQDRTGQGIYYGISIDSYNNAFIANNLNETSELTDTIACIDISNVNYIGYPFIEIYNEHTMIPYDGWISNTQFYVRRIYLH